MGVSGGVSACVGAPLPKSMQQHTIVSAQLKISLNPAKRREREGEGSMEREIDGGYKKVAEIKIRGDHAASISLSTSSSFCSWYTLYTFHCKPVT